MRFRSFWSDESGGGHDRWSLEKKADLEKNPAGRVSMELVAAAGEWPVENRRIWKGKEGRGREEGEGADELELLVRSW